MLVIVHPEFAGSKIIIFPMIFGLETLNPAANQKVHACTTLHGYSLSYMKYSICSYSMGSHNSKNCYLFTLLSVILKCTLLANSVARNSLNCARWLHVVPRITSCVNCNSKINCGHTDFICLSKNCSLIIYPSVTKAIYITIPT